MEKNTVFVEKLIREKLGLKDPEMFRLDALLKLGERVKAEGAPYVSRSTERRTGRTTSVIVAALVHLALHPNERIRFADEDGRFSSPSYRMMEQAYKWALDLGLEAGQIRRDTSDAKIFCDHAKP